MAQDPKFVETPRTTLKQLAAANTASDGSGTLEELFTAATNGSRVDRITVTNAQAAPAASSAMLVKVFVSDTTGAAPTLYAEAMLPATTRSNTATGANFPFTFLGGLLLKSGQKILISQSIYAGVQDRTAWVLEGGDY